MGRIRSIKPDFFLHEELFDLERKTGLPIRIAFAGLWTQCDREGRFKWKIRTLKAAILPHDELEFSRVLDALWTRGFVEKYHGDNGDTLGFIPSFGNHQSVNFKEAPSILPEPHPERIVTRDLHDDVPFIHASFTREPREDDGKEGREGRGKEGKGRKEVQAPTLEEVLEYFQANGYSEEIARKAFEFYDTASWRDSKGNKVKNWKQKMIGVWFKPENKVKPAKAPGMPNNEW